MKTTKTIALVLALCTISVAIFAQEEEKPFRQPVKGNCGISLNFVGLAAVALNSGVDPFNNTQVLDFRYFIADKLALRAGFGLNTASTKTKTANDTTGGIPLTETEVTNKTSAFSFGIGAEKHFKTKSKTIDPYVGAGLYMSLIGKNKANNMSKTTFANGDYNQMESETITPGGLGFGVGLNAGFFWFFAENIALGGEYGFGFGTGYTGGDTEVNNSTKSSVGGTVTTTESSSTTTNKTTNSAFRTGSTGAINLLVTF
jgi:hypothetical protein